MRLREIIIILIKLPAKSYGMKHHLKFELGKVLYQQFGSSTRRKPGYTFVAKGTSLFLVLTFFDFGVRTEGGS
jgi:hypothetical protein